jgi:hypothetical protein
MEEEDAYAAGEEIVISFSHIRGIIEAGPP